MNIFFFGSSSFAAQDLVNDLDIKHNTYFFSRKKNKQVKKNHFFYFDLNKKKLRLSKSIKLKKIDYLFFFSSYVPIKEEESSWKQCKNTNVHGLINLLMNLKLPIKKIIFASSCSLYGHNKKINIEDSFLKPSSGYSLSKYMQENILRIYSQNNNISFLSYRLGYVYGKKMKKQRLVKKFLLNYKKKKFKVYNKNLNLNLIHTKDISNLIVKTFEKAEGVFNLTSPVKTTIEYFYNTLLGKKNKIINKKNNYSSRKFFKKFPKLKIPKLEKRIKDFVNEI